MNVLKRIFGRDGKFYDLLEASALEAKNSAAILARILPQHGTADFEQTLADLAQTRRKHKRTSQEITEELCKNFVTPMEREDIEALSNALYRITKNVEKIGERLLIYPHQIAEDQFSKQIKMIEGAADSVAAMVSRLRTRTHVEKISDTYERLQIIEGEADKLMVALLRELYQGEIDVRTVIILKDLYELFEKVIDRCRDAGNVVFQVVLKYS
jgi:uncharacterized protein Yka (UPF0111/DUF47 family)